jgi:Icc-related predicted phosphoesterase
MKLVCIADSHGRHKNITLPDGDVLVVAGDITSRGEIELVGGFNKWIGKQNFKHKIVIAGNHDFCFENNLRKIAVSTLDNCTYLEDSGITIEGIKFWGSPWQPNFNNWAFNLDRGEKISQKWKMIPDDVNVLITHGPPFGMLDRTFSTEERVGCEELYKKISSLKSLKIHVFGHIHETYGIREENNIKYINCSVCDLCYKVVNSPVVVEI